MKKSIFRTGLKSLLKLGIGSIALVCGLSFGVFYHYAKVLPDVQKILTTYEPPVVTAMYAKDGSVLAEFYNEKRYVVPLEGVPKHVIDAFVAAEDQHFYEHKGLDYWGILRAFAHNVMAGGLVEGGSTITQQLTRNLLRLRGRSLSRKIKEALLAYKIEKQLTKDQILGLYLNQIFLGHGAYGVEAAARLYFRKTTPDLTLAEAAFLSGLTPAPNAFSPHRNAEAAKNRQRYVLRRMVEDLYITEDQALEAWNQPVELFPLPGDTVYAAHYFVEHVRRQIESRYGSSALYANGLKIFTTVDVRDQEAAEASIRRGLIKLDKRLGYRGPLRKLADAGAIEAYLTELGARQDDLNTTDTFEGVVTDVRKKGASIRVDLGGQAAIVRMQDHSWLVPEGHFPSLRLFEVGDVLPLRLVEIPKDPEKEIPALISPAPEIQGALLAVDVKTGEVRAMVGGYDYATSEFNRTVQAQRQPGSAFKPVIYAAALQEGFTPSTLLYDTAVVLPFRLNDDEEMWKPRNFEKEFQGPTTFREGLIKSRNIITVKILREIGVEKAINLARDLGITAPLEKNLSLALGAAAISPMELSLPYLVFAGGGKKIEPKVIRAVYDRDGKLLEGEDIYRKKSPAEKVVQLGNDRYLVKPGVGEQVLSPQIAYLTTHLLQEVIWFGTGRSVASLGRPAAGKTGTTNDFRDAWFVGYTPQLLATVWVGLDDARSMGSKATGTSFASPIWLDFMQTALKDVPIEEFDIPEGIVFAKIDADTGLRAVENSRRVVYEAFVAGTEPQEYAPDPDQAPPDKFYEQDFGL